MNSKARQITYDELTPDVQAVLDKHLDAALASGNKVSIWFVPCDKVGYGHKETAETAAQAMNQKTGDTYDAYHCGHCQSWHIGHSRSGK